jgi:hypothetical protein
VVEVAHHARIREASSCRSAECSIPEEVAADKTLALFIRAAARDLVDVAALPQRYMLEQLCELAAEKDQVSTAVLLADALAATAAHSDRALPNSAWSRRLSPLPRPGQLGAGPNCLVPRACTPPDAVQSFGARRCRGRKRPALPALRDCLKVIGHHRSTRGETANQRPF